MKKSGQFLDEWGREKAKERYGMSTGGSLGRDESESRIDKARSDATEPVGGPATDSDLLDMDTENYPVKLRTRPDAYGESGREQLKRGK